MAADQQSHIFSSVSHDKTSPSPAPKSARNKTSLSVLPQAATSDAKVSSFIAASAAASTSIQPTSLCRMQAGRGDRAKISVICGPAVGTELSPSQTPCTSDGSDLSITQQIQYDAGCCSSSKRTGNHALVPLQVHVIAMDNELGSVELRGRQFSSKKGLEPASKKLCVANTDKERPQNGRKFLEAAAGEVDQGVDEEEGCTTPTARDQQIPQYGAEVSALVCPPAPKKKACVSKRRRRLSTADTMSRGAAGRTADNFNSHSVAERRAFLVDPPDLQNFPDCIRALFK